MSSETVDTRRRILQAARKLVEQKRGAPVSMGEIARQAEVSRQALYLHFASRTELLLELSRMVDATHRTPERQAEIDRAPDGRSALKAAVALQVELKPKLRAVIEAFDVLRRTDPDAEAAWSEREEARRARAKAVIDRLHEEGELARDLQPKLASDLFWAVTSQQFCDMLAQHCGWQATMLRTQLTRLLEEGLLRRGLGT